MRFARLLLAGAAALLPVAHGDSPGLAAVPGQHDGFVPPSGDIMLSRTVYRQLADGKQISVTRRYRVHFIANGTGFELDGSLVDVTVDVPPILERLADVERKRPDVGLFPVQLDARGTILAGKPAQRDPSQSGNLVSAAGDIIGSSALDPATRTQLLGLVSQLAESTPNSPWPTDLFRAAPGERRQQRQVNLPDGSLGEIDVTMRVGQRQECGLPQSVERIIVTRVGGTERVSREVWAMSPA